MCILHIEAAVFCLQIILPIQTSSPFPPKWTVPLLNNSRLMLSFRLMERYTWALYPSPATTALELTCHNFSDYLAGMVKIILRVGARKKLHTKTLCRLKSQLPLFGEASLNQIDGCVQQNYMHTVNQPLRVWLLPQLTELRSWLSLSGIDFPTISTYLWHHGPRKGRPPWYQRSCKSNLDRKHAEIVVDLYPSPGLPTKVPFRMAGAKQSHLKVERKMPWKGVHRYGCIIRDWHIDVHVLNVYLLPMRSAILSGL